MSDNAPLDGASDAPPLADVMPWSVPPLRLGRGWVRAPDAASLRKRWSALIRVRDEAERSALFGPTRSRTLHSAVAPLPGRSAPGVRLRHENGTCPDPVPVLHGPYDRQWLIPDSRLIDAARAELWRVTDGRQIHLVETDAGGRHPGPVVSFSALVPDGHSAAGRGVHIRPLHRRPGGRDPNLAPGLLDHLAQRLERTVTATDFLAWTATAACRGRPGGPAVVPLTADRDLWEHGVELGRRSLWLHTRGAYDADGTAGADSGGPRLPGGRRPYVRAAVTAPPAADGLAYDADERTLHIGSGRISPVAPEAWRYETAGAGVLETWFAERTPAPGAQRGTLESVRAGGWPQEWTSELLELITVLTLLAELRPGRRELLEQLRQLPTIGADELRGVGVLPPPAASRRPASVLDLHEEGPDGQLALL